MKTNDLQADLAAMREKHAKAESDLVREHAIRAALPDSLDGLPVRIHLHGLYGTTASVKVEYDFYRYGRDDKQQPTLEDALTLAEQLAPCSVRKIKDGCLSFQLGAYVDSLDKAKKERWQEEIEVSPFRIKVGAFQQHTMTIEWAAVLGNEIVDVDFILPLPRWLGNLEVHYQNYMGGKRVDRCNFMPNKDAVFSIFRDDEELAQLAASPIKWGRGSDETPNDFTLYWHDLRDDIGSTPADLIRTLIAARDKAATPKVNS